MGGEEWRIREFVNNEAILCGTAFLDTRDYSFSEPKIYIGHTKLM